jgi:carboxylesterase type B
MLKGGKAVVDFIKSVFNNPGGTAAPLESEDCLYLNVFTPIQDTPQSSKKSVLLWIFGVCDPS